MSEQPCAVESKVEYEQLVDIIDQALRNDGWLHHTEELEDWHLNAIANAVAKRLTQLPRADGSLL